MTVRLGCTGIAAAVAMALGSMALRAQTPVRISLPAESLADSLRDLGTQTQTSIVFDPGLVEGRKSAPLDAQTTLDEALTRLLAGTGIGHRFLNERTVVLVRPGARASQVPGAKEETSRTAAPELLHLAQADQSVPPRPDSNGPGDSPDSRAQLEEIVVTAQKRAERLQDVPMSLSALSGDQLTRAQDFRFEDYIGKVPGVTLIDTGALGSQLVIRGITTGSGAVNSSVATYIDETPYGGVGPYADAVFIAPNLDTFDMERIEVLRGPQGTLYGANALGGLLKYVTKAPDPTGFEAKVEAGVNSVANGGTGFDTHAMVNIPLRDDLALRIVGYDNDYPGFIDDPARHLTDINGNRFVGTRISLLYQPNSDLSVRVNALYQDKFWSDWPNEDVMPVSLHPTYGNLKQEHVVGQPGDAVTQLYNLTVNYNLGFASLLSTTSYSDYKFHSTWDYTDQYGALLSGIFAASYGAVLKENQPVEALTQEIRLASPSGQALQWQVGSFFTTQRAYEQQGLYAVQVPSAAVLYNFPGAAGLANFYIPVRYQEYAGFANVDYHITPTVEVGVGGRYSENHQRFHEVGLGPLGGAADYGTLSSEGVLTYSTDLRWHMTPDQMLYARVAEGFVPGGPNDAIPTANFPHTYSSSTTMNYEAGFKGSWLDRRFSTELSVFDIDWRRIQLLAAIDGLATTTNGGTARSLGAEWNFTYMPVRGLTFDLNGAYTDAYLTGPTPASVNGHVGDRLPAVPLWGTSAGIRYERALSGEYSGFVGLDHRFTGLRYADFTAVGPRQSIPSFHIVDLRAGVENPRWSLTVYVKNVGNRIAINYVQPETLNGGLGAQTATIYAPRTIGATVGVSF